MRMWSLGRPGQKQRCPPPPPDPRPSPTGPARTLAQGSGQHRGRHPVSLPVSRQFTLTHSFRVRHRLWTFNHRAGAFGREGKGWPDTLGWRGSSQLTPVLQAPCDPGGPSSSCHSALRQEQKSSVRDRRGRLGDRGDAQGGGCGTGPVPRPPTAEATSLLQPCPPPCHLALDSVQPSGLPWAALGPLGPRCTGHSHKGPGACCWRRREPGAPGRRPWQPRFLLGSHLSGIPVEKPVPEHGAGAPGFPG